MCIVTIAFNCLRLRDTADSAHNRIHFVVLRNSITVSTCKQPLLFTVQQRLYVYPYSNDIHNVATNVSLTQQLFALLFFLVQFKTLGSTLEPGLAIKLCAKALSSK